MSEITRKELILALVACPEKQGPELRGRLAGCDWIGVTVDGGEWEDLRPSHKGPVQLPFEVPTTKGAA